MKENLLLRSMKTGSKSLQAAGVLALMAGSSVAHVDAAPAANRVIMARSVGAARLGITVASARKALKGYTFERASDGDGVALIAALKGKKPVMTLYAGEDDPSASINEKAVIQLIEVTDAGYATKAGVRPGMPLKDVERRYGKLKRIFKSEIESREYAEFAKGPAGLTFRILASNGDAGRYKAGGARVASAYTPTAYVYSISITKR